MSKIRCKNKQPDLLYLSLFTVLSLTSTTLFAAGPQLPSYSISDSVKSANTPVTPVEQKAPPIPVIIQQEDRPMALPEGEKIAIRDFRIEGAEFLDPRELSSVLEPYRNMQLTMDDINAAANKVTVLCRDKGYLVARAYVPKQNVQNGILLIKVVVGQYGSFQIKNSSLVRDSFIQSVFDRARTASAIVTKDGIERPMLLINDMPGAGMPLITIAPGSEVGSSDFLVDVPPANRVKGYIAADNYGSHFTGENRLNAGLDINSLLGFSDRLSLNGVTSKAAGLQNGRVAYAFPLSANGLRGEIAASRTTDKLGAEFADLNAKGVSNIAEATLSYPLKRTQEDSIYLTLNVAGKRIKEDISAVGLTVAERVKVANFGVSRETFSSLFGYSSYANLSGGFSVGRLELDDALQSAMNQAGANTVGNYTKAYLSFKGNLVFSTQWRLETTAQAQQALGRNLDPSEQLSISGPGAIRSYTDPVSNDNGYVLGGELKYTLPSLANFDHGIGLLANYGAVSPQDGRFSSTGEVRIGDVGAAYFVSNNTIFGRVQLSKTMGNAPETSSSNHKWKLLALVGTQF